MLRRNVRQSCGALPFKGAAASKFLPYLASKALSEKEVSGFVENKEWLQKLCEGFELKEPSSEENGTPGKTIPAKPRVFMYGSAVAGTAFHTGDVDFALGFESTQQQPTENGNESNNDSSGGSASPSHKFVEVDREHQPEVLGQLYEHLYKQTGDQVRFQRIFRARIPILQYVPVLSENQLANEANTSLEFKAPPSSGSEDSATAGTTSAAEDAAPAKPTAAPPTPLTFTKPSAGKYGASKFVSSVTQRKNLDGEPIDDPPVGATNTSGSGSGENGNTEKKAGKQGVQGIDISLSLDGCRNSLLIRSYIQANPMLGPLIMCLKHWGRHAGILNARRGWLSPYALSILAIHYAHTKLDVPLLPVDEMDILLGKPISPLSLVPGGGQNNNVDPKASDDDSNAAALRTACLVNQSFLQDFKVVATQDEETKLEQALQGFFDFYSDDATFDFDSDVVDIRHYTTETADGENTRITSKADWHEKLLKDMSDRDKWHRLGHGIILIRDPFEAHSLGRSVDFFHAEAIREAFRQCSKNKGFYLKDSNHYTRTHQHHWEKLFVQQ